MRIFILISILFVLTACGTARTLVMEPVHSTNKYTNLMLVADNPTVDVPIDVINTLESTIKKGLYEDGPFTNGGDLRIHYTFISRDQGNRFARWFWGGIGNAGEGSITILVSYKDENDKEIAKTQVEGRIGSGFFGGSISDAIRRAGEDIVDFTVRQFSPNL